MSVATEVNKRYKEMRVLKFIVDGYMIKPDPTCDFGNMTPGTENHVEAQFSFSPEWNNCVKVAAFYSMLGMEYEPQPIGQNNTCMIPLDALRRHRFKIQVIGQNTKEDIKFNTNKLTIEQRGGN